MARDGKFCGPLTKKRSLELLARAEKMLPVVRQLVEFADADQPGGIPYEEIAALNNLVGSVESMVGKAGSMLSIYPIDGPATAESLLSAAANGL